MQNLKSDISPVWQCNKKVYQLLIKTITSEHLFPQKVSDNPKSL